jgi:hypothetical protein
MESLCSLLRDLVGSDWQWHRNTKCKYVSIRVDMRDGCAVLLDRHGNVIDEQAVRWQYSTDTPAPKGGR